MELVAVYGQPDGVSFEKDGFPILFDTQRLTGGRLILAGPAKVNLVVSAEGAPRQGIATFVVKPEVFPPDRTITVGPGAGGAIVNLECSIDLVNWTATTNGVYTNLPAAKFFRIKAERIP